jgi:hypothetical protein
MRLRQVLPAVGSAALVLIAAAACGIGRNTLVDGITGTATVTQVRLDGPGAGDVTVRLDSSVHESNVQRTVHYGGSTAPAQTARFDSSTLVLSMDCGNDCSVGYVVTLPAAAGVSGSTASGDVTISDMSTVDVTTSSGDVGVQRINGPVTVSTSSGDITATTVSGAVNLHATSGDIIARDLTGTQTTLEATSGDITVDLATPGDLAARATSGDIDVKVPAGAYHVVTDVTSGDVHVNVTNQPDAAHTLDLHATSGDIDVNPR